MRRKKPVLIFRKNVNVERADFYIDSTFKIGRENLKKFLEIQRKTKKHYIGKRTKGQKERQSYSESESEKNLNSGRITAMAEWLSRQMEKITEAFPETGSVSDFYRELISCTVGTAELKKALAAVNWCGNRINSVAAGCRKRISEARDSSEIIRISREFDGRFSSFLKQINPQFEFLIYSSTEMKNYPTIKDMFGVAIAGFPNVGKTTLLSKITKSSPEIKNYAFTTKSIMLGYMSAFDYYGAQDDIQIMDTPGTLSRLEKMNDIEKQAYIAMRYASNMIIYVFDPSETYTLEVQEKLFSEIESFGKQVYIYISKTDIKNSAVAKNTLEIEKRHKSEKDPEKIKELIRGKAIAYYKSKMRDA
ncbi:MAG: 50S ribosome-binding GTPase [Candidatus Woesearchaeota archaeon]|nr:50S ribosome-binding GTPase [Candidatus Woesearchaeota archaeon]